MFSRIRHALITVAAISAVAGACSSTSSTAKPTASTNPAQTATSAGHSTTTTETGATITIHNFAYGAPITVRPGATVTVRNTDNTAHTVSAANGSFDTMPIFGGSSKTFTAPTKPGVYSFHCNIHANMHGTLIVRG